MGRDDNQQSVGIFSNRLKKTPRGVGDRKLRVAEIERQFRLKQQTVNDSSKETNKVPQYSSKGMPEASTKEDLDKIPASGFVPPKTAAGETNYVTLTEAKERAKVRMVWGQTPSEDFPSPDTLTSQTPLSGFPTSSSRKFHGTAYEQPAAGAQPRTQADKARKRWAQQMDKSSTTEKVEESFWEQGPPTSDPNTERRYMLPKYKRTARPQHAAQEKPARGDKSAKFPVWLPGETYEDFAVRLRSFCDQGPRTDPEEEAQPSSTTPPDSPPSLITNQTPKFEDSETPYRAFVSSVSSTESGTAADAVHLDPFSTPDHRRNSKAQPNTKPQAKDRASGNRFRQDSRTNAAPKHGTPSDFPLSFSNRYRKYQSTEPDSLAADMRRFRVEYEKKMLGGRSTHTFTPAGEVPKSSPKRQTSPFFTILPPEIRHVIYSESLCTAKIIRGGELVEDKRTAVIIDDVRPSAMDLGIDATFLRTCWKIYREALPILYQDNWFGFSQVRMLKTFRTKGLALKGYPGQYLPSPVLDFKLQLQGRLCLLRNLHLKLDYDPRYSTIRDLHGLSTSATSLGARSFNLQHQDQWSEFLNEERYSDRDGYVAFRSLSNLVLDFSDWNLKASEGLRIRVFEDKFRGADGLRNLTVVGLSHQPTIELFRVKLLGKGGKMKVLPRNALGKEF